jgi:hypothetical protein
MKDDNFTPVSVLLQLPAELEEGLEPISFSFVYHKSTNTAKSRLDSMNNDEKDVSRRTQVGAFFFFLLLWKPVWFRVMHPNGLLALDSFSVAFAAQRLQG